MSEYDVIVAGGGPGGWAAGVAAARSGAKVLLVEREAYLGGMATAGLVLPFMAYHAGDVQLSAGLFQELIDRLSARGAMRGRHTFDDEALKLVLDEMVAEAGVEVLLGGFAVDGQVAGRRIESLTVATKSGPEQVRGRVFVDATGDGDVAARAGAPCEFGRPADGLCQPMTLCFRLAGVAADLHDDAVWRALREDLNRIYLSAKADGRLTNPRENVLIFRTVRPDVIHFNTTRVVGRSAIDARDLTAAEVEGRRQVRELAAALCAESPALRRAYVSKIAARIGVRESRRVMGDYVMTDEDIVQARKFPDAIARANYVIDIHNPAGTGTVIKQVPPGEWYDVPYRSLVPRGVENLLVGGRSISSTHEAHSAVRIMPTVTTIGQAAGTAAALAVETGRTPREIDVDTLRRRLLEAGASLTEQ
jgi:hypothetical protein